MKKILLSIFSIMLSIAAFAQPGNDPFASATELVTIAAGAIVLPLQTNIAATQDGPIYQNCHDENNTVGHYDVWYTIETGTAATLTVVLDDVSNSKHNYLDLYRDLDTLTFIDCSYNYASTTLTIDIAANTEYHLRAYFGWWGSDDFTLTATIAPINNDLFTNAYALVTTGGVQTLGGQTSVTATTDGPVATCDSGGSNPLDVWYTVETDADYVLTVDVTNSTGQTVVDLLTYDGSSFTSIACAKADQMPSFKKTVSTGQLYYVRVYMGWGGGATFDIAASLAPVPAGDESGDALLVTYAAPVTGQSFVNATVSPEIIDPLCDIGGNLTHDDLWYYIETFETGGEIEIYLTHDASTQITLYNDAFAILDCNSSWSSGSAVTPIITYTDPPGFERDGGLSSRAMTTYYIRLFGINTTPTNLTISVAGTALPIELTSFSVKASDANNVIDWSTASEINSAYFEVQSSPTGLSDWKTIGKVDAMGESSRLVSYHLIDNNPYTQTFYRLNSVDLDGKSELSDLISVTRKDKANNIRISPNPTNSTIKMQTIASAEENATINVRSFTGKIYLSKNVDLNNGLNNIELDLNDLPSGVYLLELHTELNGILTEKIIKQ